MPKEKTSKEKTSTVAVPIIKATSSVITPRTFARVRDALVATHVTQPSGCIFSTLQVNGRGHTQIKVAAIKYLGHRIAAADKDPPALDEYNAKAGKVEASHRCGVPRCIKPDHLVFESAEINQTRDCCRYFRNLLAYRCPHNPPCINKDTGAPMQQC